MQSQVGVHSFFFFFSFLYRLIFLGLGIALHVISELGLCYYALLFLLHLIQVDFF